MQLTHFTDYGLRVLMYLGAKDADATIGEIVTSYGISKNHLTKVVHKLAKLGYIHSTRGKGGGIRLAQAPAAINVGAVVLAMESNFHLVECFNPATSLCPLTPSCLLKRVLGEAQQNFLATLERYTLADLIVNKAALNVLFLPVSVRPELTE